MIFPILAAITISLLPGTLSSDSAIIWAEGEETTPCCKVYLNGRRLPDSDGRAYPLQGLRADTDYKVLFKDPDGNKHALQFRTLPLPVVLNVKDYGAKGDGLANDTAAIQAAIDACPAHGEVLVPSGLYMTGALFIRKSDISLRISEGATLQAIRDLAAFPMVRNIYEGWEKDVYSSVLNIGKLHGERVARVRIFGGGTIDNGGDVLSVMQTAADGRMSRAHGLPIIRCDDVAIEGITIRNPGTWNVHPLFCDGFTTYRCHLVSSGYGLTNADGWDPDASRRCYLVDSVLDGQDDNVAVKSLPGHSSELVRIYGCHFIQGGGLVVGAELSGGASDIVFEKCKVKHCDRGIHVCTRPLGAGRIEDIHFRDIEIGYAGCWGINVTLWYWIQNFISADYPLEQQLSIGNISFSNIRIDYADGNAVQVLGTAGRPVEGVSFENVRIGSSKYDVVLRNCRDVRIAHCSFGENYLVTENAEGEWGDGFRLPHSPHRMSDSLATYATYALYEHLHRVSESGRFLLGVQDATASGYGWKDDSGISDIERLCGEKPEVYCWDYLDVVAADGSLLPSADKIRRLVCQAFYEGGVNSFCWHMPNLSTGGSFYSLSAGAVRDILPGGCRNDAFKRMLVGVAEFNASLIGKDGALVPIIFRPWHEFDGDWFWWGRKCRNSDELKELYRYTETVLRDSLGVHNFIWAYSPDINFTTQDEYLKCYPGDEWVDVLGLDNYWLYRKEVEGVLDAALRLKIISDYALASGKVAAFTETGQGGISEPDWFSAKLLRSIYDVYPSVYLAYVAFWRNSVKGYFTPYPGHPAEADFLQFLADPRVVTLWKHDWLGQYYHL